MTDNGLRHRRRPSSAEVAYALARVERRAVLTALVCGAAGGLLGSLLGVAIVWRFALPTLLH